MTKILVRKKRLRPFRVKVPPLTRLCNNWTLLNESSKYYSQMFYVWEVCHTHNFLFIFYGLALMGVMNNSTQFVRSKVRGLRSLRRNRPTNSTGFSSQILKSNQYVSVLLLVYRCLWLGVSPTPRNIIFCRCIFTIFSIHLLLFLFL